MGKLFRFLKPYAASICAIIAVLVLQAYCDLSLPAYTSDIVNVGIQQGGIDSSIPEEIRKEDMEKLFLFVTKEDQETVKECYRESGDRYVLKEDMKKDSAKSEELTEILGKPMLLVYGMENGSDSSENTNMMGEMPDFSMLAQMPEEQRMRWRKSWTICRIR